MYARGRSAGREGDELVLRTGRGWRARVARDSRAGVLLSRAPLGCASGPAEGGGRLLCYVYGFHTIMLAIITSHIGLLHLDT